MRQWVNRLTQENNRDEDTPTAIPKRCEVRNCHRPLCINARGGSRVACIPFYPICFPRTYEFLRLYTVVSSIQHSTPDASQVRWALESASKWKLKMEVDLHASAAHKRRLSVCPLSFEDIYSDVMVQLTGKHDSSPIERWCCFSPYCTEHQ